MPYLQPPVWSKYNTAPDRDDTLFDTKLLDLNFPRLPSSVVVEKTVQTTTLRVKATTRPENDFIESARTRPHSVRRKQTTKSIYLRTYLPRGGSTRLASSSHDFTPPTSCPAIPSSNPQTRHTTRKASERRTERTSRNHPIEAIWFLMGLNLDFHVRSFFRGGGP
ncbi:hypothetical protein BDV41DRAFT_288205 [Aspergillus transmontanensis]|uniref:Uncharacterized protein n=1 Tax=Aspergillus transmontanensis TaxID=1034304 RepID=A0A5N6WE53_9EURO|nr:hypothetical protein BDV41DRAFT_288205 [Aspergillus transmontanensis]